MPMKANILLACVGFLICAQMVVAEDAPPVQTTATGIETNPAQMRGVGTFRCLADGKGSWLMAAIKITTLAGLAGSGVYAARQWMKKTGQVLDDAFRNGILADAARILAQETGMSDSAAQVMLKEAIDDGRQDSALDRLLRIECAVAQISTSECRQRVIVVCAAKDGASVNVLETARTVRWIELPDMIRREFMSKGQDEKYYLLFERPTDNNPKTGDQANV